LAPTGIQAADTVWMMVCTALVLLMTPALGFFYGGMVRTKNALNTLMMSMAAFGVVGLLWVAFGYSLSFSTNGGFANAFLHGVGMAPRPDNKIPELLFMAYQATFAVVTAALVSGAVVERMRFSAYLAFIGLWSLIAYCPTAHWVWGGGWLSKLGALDYAGGTVVHINAGIAALVLALVVGPRKEYGRQASLPHHVPSILLGAGLLWFGWFGFNAGSALEANTAAVLAFVNTMICPMVTLATWMTLDYLRTKRITAVGAATGIVVGLVGITPAAGYVSPTSALIIGLLVTFPSYFAIIWRSRSSLDDSLDVFAGHGLGGITGALLTGVFAEKAWGGTDGLLYGNPKQLAIQAAAVVSCLVYTGVVSFVIVKGLSLVMKLRVSSKTEGRGLDVALHGEEAYTTGEGAVLILNNLQTPARLELVKASMTA
jgi:Amt family ammonium transporter